jgi:hypothetical protein
MAKAASRDGVAADLKPVEYKKGVDIIRNRIKAKKDHVSSTNGEISALWDQVEKLGINKKGAKIFLSLDGMEDHERKDVLRTVNQMAKEAGWDEGGDMVDKLEGTNVVTMPTPGGKKGKAKDEEKPAPPADDSDLAGDDADPNAPIEPATFKSAIVDFLQEESEGLDNAEAYVIANRLYDERDTTKPLTHNLAIELAQAEIDTWPEAETTQ